MIPRQSMSLLEPMLNSFTLHRRGLLWFGMVTTLWLTSVGAKAVIAGLDIVYEVHAPRSLWMNRFIAFGLTSAVGVLLLFAVLITFAGPMIERFLATAVWVQHLWIELWPYLQWLLAGMFTFAAIELLYLLAPNVPVARRMTIPGAIVAAAAWLLLSWGLSFYFHEIGELKLDALYGVLATPIALLIWLKWVAAAILAGAEINVTLQFSKWSRELERQRLEAA
jgi:membrane protein